MDGRLVAVAGVSSRRSASGCEAGTSSVYRRLASAVAEKIDRVLWCAKPAGEPYAAFLGRLPAAEAWQRQMVLGPAPEFCLFGAAPAGVEAVTVQARVVDDATGR
jgi:hypothetical protein